MADSDDDWDNSDYVNDVTEEEQRKWGAKHNVQAGEQELSEHAEQGTLQGAVKNVVEEHEKTKEAPNFARGYGGKHGVEEDRMDKSAHNF